jgi:hypothetical protein
VLLSNDEFLVGDTQWAAADTVAVARAWPASHPEV